MNDIPENPHAFPQSMVRIDPAQGFGEARSYGMTLRDYFAAKALENLIIIGGSPDPISRKAYDYADAMLKARQS